MFITVKWNRFMMIGMLAVVLSGVCFGILFGRSIAVSVPQESVQVAVIMYHGLLDDSEKQNQYVIDPRYFEEDLQYLCDNGYHTIFASELISHFEKGTPLPEKPVLLTFDDGYYNNYTLAYPLLKKYHCKAVIAPIGYAADEAERDTPQNPAYSQCTWKQLREMAESGFVEIQNHTYNLHHIDNGRNGAKNNPGENLSDYRKMLTDDLTMFNSRMYEEIGQYPEVIVFPFGSRSPETLKIVKEMHFKAAFDCEEKLNTFSCADDLFYIHRFLRPNYLSSKEFFENKVDIDSISSQTI